MSAIPNYDFWTADRDVMADIFGSSYNYGYSVASDLTYETPKKCQITEIIDDDFEDDFDEDDINVDELTKAFDNVVEDWKIKMEVIIGEGLKKLRKASKEKKMMMKYLPGDRRINAAKKDIAKDWKIDFQKGFGTTHKKLEKLAADKAKEVENVVKTDVKEPQMFQNKYKKQVVNINLRSNQESAYGNLKELISQLDKMINYVQSDVSPTVHSIPIYSKYYRESPQSVMIFDSKKKSSTEIVAQFEEARGQVLPAYNNQWLNLQKSMLNVGNRQSFLDVLEDFKLKYNQDKVIKKITKSRVEGTNVVMAQRRMLERKMAKKALSTESTKHVLREFQKDGKDHYLIVKKKTVTHPDMEEILSDWNQNLDASHQQRKQAAIVARKTRTRKLSNRALRKSLVKEIEENEKKKPVSYSDALKKNLKAPMEDIFEAWRDYLQELDDIVRNDSRTSFCKDESVESILENAENYQQELQNCGQPTVPTTSTSFHPKCKKKGFEKEVIFASWRSNLTMPDDYSQACNSDFYFFKNDSYQAENYFASWKRNLNDCQSRSDSSIDPESFLEGWVHNFEGPMDAKMDKQESKMLKNKQRNQRRSKKGNKQQN